MLWPWRRVRLSNDVEENPGPVNESVGEKTAMSAETTLFMDSVGKLELSLQSKLDTILTNMQAQAETLKRQEDMLKRFGVEQEEVKETIIELCHEVNVMKGSVARNEQSINALQTRQDELIQTIGAMEDEINRLEGFFRRNNIKFFGSPENVGQTCRQ